MLNIDNWVLFAQKSSSRGDRQGYYSSHLVDWLEQD